MIILNETALPSPASLSVRVSPQGGSAQYNTLGNTVLDNLRDKRTVDIIWSRLSAAQLSQIATLLKDGGFFTLTYPDPLSGGRTMTCRAKAQSARVYRYENGVPTWADVNLTLEEQ